MRPLRRCSVLFAALAVFLSTACGGDDKPGTTDPPADTGLTAEEESTATTIAGAFNALSQVGNLVIGAVRGALPAAAPAAGGEALGGVPVLPASCPTITIESRRPPAIGLAIDFGTGCTTDSGLEASGKLLVTWQGGSTTDSVAVAFQSFSTDGYGIDGTLSAVGKGAAWTCRFVGTVTSDGKAWTIDAALGLVIDNHGTLTNPDDDTTSVTGGGTIAADGTIYVVTITQALIFQASCNYPVTGILTYQEQSGGGSPRAVYGIDFGAGDCCTVRVSVAGRSEEMSLCTAG